MFTQSSIRYFMKQMFPDHTLQKGLIEIVQKEASGILESIDLTNFKTVYESVKKNDFPPNIILAGDDYLRRWSIMENQSPDEYSKGMTGIEEINNSTYGANGVYRWPIKLMLNPHTIEQSIGDKYDKKKCSAYITLIVQQFLTHTIVLCLEKNTPKDKRLLKVDIVKECTFKIKS